MPDEKYRKIDYCHNLDDESCISLSWHQHFSSVGFRGSLGMKGYIGKYCICWYIKSLIRDGLSNMEKKKISLNWRDSQWGHINAVDLDTIFAYYSLLGYFGNYLALHTFYSWSHEFCILRYDFWEYVGIIFIPQIWSGTHRA